MVPNMQNWLWISWGSRTAFTDKRAPEDGDGDGSKHKAGQCEEAEIVSPRAAWAVYLIMLHPNMYFSFWNFLLIQWAYVSWSNFVDLLKTMFLVKMQTRRRKPVLKVVELGIRTCGQVLQHAGNDWCWSSRIGSYWGLCSISSIFSNFHQSCIGLLALCYY